MADPKPSITDDEAARRYRQGQAAMRAEAARRRAIAEATADARAAAASLSS
ncbi:hypothetical protein ACIOEX_29370 [Streptomyces sp. NPDC087850]|uniref:hypothetical protein n=1 Tax=Streptomyces sp. NPDC087850 TaxID=3365809 RepID=UPI00380AF709